MKTLALILSLVLTTTLSHSQDNIETYSITVKVDNALSDNGSMLIGLHNEDTFMKGKGLQNSKSEIVDGIVTVTFENVAPGNYAIMVLHDENDNSKMDFDATGRPSESYGMSNNPMLFGPPTFTDAKFELLKENLEIHIRF
ncbi:DUF2141 domain-containing protein [Xanthomarina spongicola]|uniref:Uncharacterized protein (DUF2141 family) n=1 Tax=Xanthomarina spongicola TaxID=570520 RepID=A0A316DG41_9FLAO|nr:DUF2141 domain-containing protein [Xanthomarina spongicola]PWK17267.1 uncharacterized protein (DUF2141 family) [Xanthomarina spongicola]